MKDQPSLNQTTKMIAAIRAGLESEVLARELSIEVLKALWDQDDWPLNDVLNGVRLEHVHAELNRRGEGAYCAV